MEYDAFLCYSVYSRKHLGLIKQLLDFLKRGNIEIWPTKDLDNVNIYVPLVKVLTELDEISRATRFFSKL